MMIKTCLNNAKSLIGFAFFVGIGMNALTNSPANAQANESFSECVSSLDNLSNVYVDDAIEQCQSIYSSRLVEEPFSVCVANLDSLSNVYVDDAIDACKTVFYGDYVGETFSVCVANLDSLSNVYVDDAIDVCTVVVNDAVALFPDTQRR
ncbi:MAG: hypothetical protein AAFZ17_02640 [Cyanobacteria bacterium J06650_10]